MTTSFVSSPTIIHFNDTEEIKVREEEEEKEVEVEVVEQPDFEEKLPFDLFQKQVCCCPNTFYFNFQDCFWNFFTQERLELAFHILEKHWLPSNEPFPLNNEEFQANLLALITKMNVKSRDYCCRRFGFTFAFPVSSSSSSSSSSDASIIEESVA
jgi:hypothetical protein